MRLILRKYSEELFKKGFTGAYHFPWAAPLASIIKSFNTEELKHSARSLRAAAGGEKFTTPEASAVEFPLSENGTKLFGPRLNIEIPPAALVSDTAAQKVKAFFSPLVTGACLLSADESNYSIPPPPRFSFRAAAVANMFLRPIQRTGNGDCSNILGYKWKIGKLVWLPKTVRS
jgi:hypothetical protein